MSLGDNLSQPELDIGLKKDQRLHELVAFEYNREDVSGYDRNAFPNLAKGRSLPPSHFQPIDWTKRKYFFSHMKREYDDCFKNWKQSGFHESEIPTSVVEMTMACVVPFANFPQNSSSMLYLHEFIY